MVAKTTNTTKKHVKTSVQTFWRKLYAIWFVAVTVSGGLWLYTMAEFPFEKFISVSLLLIGLSKLVESLK